MSLPVGGRPHHWGAITGSTSGHRVHKAGSVEIHWRTRGPPHLSASSRGGQIQKHGHKQVTVEGGQGRHVARGRSWRVAWMARVGLTLTTDLHGNPSSYAATRSVKTSKTRDKNRLRHMSSFYSSLCFSFCSTPFLIPLPPFFILPLSTLQFMSSLSWHCSYMSCTMLFIPMLCLALCASFRSICWLCPRGISLTMPHTMPRDRARACRVRRHRAAQYSYRNDRGRF